MVSFSVLFFAAKLRHYFKTTSFCLWKTSTWDIFYNDYKSIHCNFFHDLPHGNVRKGIQIIAIPVDKPCWKSQGEADNLRPSINYRSARYWAVSFSTRHATGDARRTTCADRRSAFWRGRSALRHRRSALSTVRTTLQAHHLDEEVTGWKTNRAADATFL